MASVATRTPWTSSVIQVFADCLFALIYLNYLIIVFGYRWDAKDFKRIPSNTAEILSAYHQTSRRRPNPKAKGSLFNFDFALRI